MNINLSARSNNINYIIVMINYYQANVKQTLF